MFNAGQVDSKTLLKQIHPLVSASHCTATDLYMHVELVTLNVEAQHLQKFKLYLSFNYL